MKSQIYLHCRSARRGYLLPVAFLLTFLFAVDARGQAPYVRAVSGGSCLGESLVLELVGATATSWTVTPYVSGGVTNAGTRYATINYLTTGVYTLQVNYHNGPVGYTVGAVTVGANVTPRPVRTLSVAESATEACVGSIVTYTANATNYGDYIYCYWYVDGVYNTSTLSQPFSISTLSPGLHTITCELKSGAPCAIPETLSVTKNILITELGVSPDVSICAGGNTTLTSTGAGTHTWWPSTGLNTTTGSSVIASPATTTTYNVTDGCTTEQVTVTVNPRSAIAGSPCGPPTGTPGGGFGGTSARNGTPVVLSGSQFAGTPVNGYEATNLVAFVYHTSSSNWEQVPLQVDERKTVNGGTIYHTNTTIDGFGSEPYTLFSSLQYCDVNTWVGTDDTTTFDDNDEVVFMARDAGGDEAPVSAPYPTGVQAGAGAKITVTDPNNPSAQASYLYIFNRASTGGLEQSAGRSYVNYDFKFKIGSTSYSASQYKSNYTFFHHPENSTITSPYYQIGFSDRWTEDMVKVTVGNSQEINMVDRHRNQFLINDCSRTENTFNTGAGAYIVNKSGPIRAIRSHMGANSGPLTQREFFFYDQFEVIKTNLRVHAIPGIMDFWDYNPGVGELRYSNNNNTTGGTLDANTGQTGIPVDGSPDSVTPGPLTWQMVSSSSGTIFKHYNLQHTMGTITSTSYYLDTTSPSGTTTDPSFQCPGLGDGQAWGSSGMYLLPPVSSQLPNTDPRFANYKTAGITETNLFLKPATSRSEANDLVALVTTPLSAVVTRWPLVGGRAAAATAPVVDTAIQAADPIKIYPNPSNGIFTIEAKGAQHDRIKLVVYNAAGREVYRTEATGSITKVVDLQAPQGTGKFYVAKIHIGSKVHTRKLMVNK